MKAGATGTASYTLNGATWFLTYAPVKVNMSMYDTLDPTIFPTPMKETLVYSVGITVPEADILRPFEEVKETISGGMAGLVVTCIVLLGVVAWLAALVGSKVTSFIRAPFFLLFHLTSAFLPALHCNRHPPPGARCNRACY
jgi:hypothetical protein